MNSMIAQNEKTERTVISFCGMVILLRSQLSQLNAKCLHFHVTYLTEVDSLRCSNSLFCILAIPPLEILKYSLSVFRPKKSKNVTNELYFQNF